MHFADRDAALAKERELRDERRTYGSAGIFDRRTRGDIDSSLGYLQEREAGAALLQCAEFWVLHHPPGAPATVRTMMEELVKDRSIAVKDRRPGYLQSLTDMLEPFVKEFENRPIAELTTDAVLEWIGSRTLPDGSSVKPVTQANYYRYIRMMFALAVRRRHIPENLLSKDGNIWAQARKKRPEIINIAKAKALLEAAWDSWRMTWVKGQKPDPWKDSSIFAYVCLGLFAGVRREEAMRLAARDVKPQYDLEISEEASKVRGWRNLRLGWAFFINAGSLYNAWTQAKLDGFPDRPLIDRKNFRKRFEAVRKSAGIDPWPRNALRHLFDIV